MKIFFTLAMLSAMMTPAPAHSSPSNDDLVAYHARLQVYLAMKQTPDDLAKSLGNYFGRLGNFQYRNNPDGSIDLIYIESTYVDGQGEVIRFIANVAKLKPVYVEVVQ